MDERELVGLLHRADWTRPSLTGSVRGAATSVLSMFGLDVHQNVSREGEAVWESAVSAPPPFMASVLDGDIALDLAPGERFRLTSADGRWAGGCDGARVWQSGTELLSAGKLGFRVRPQPPVGPLLAPSWLLTGHTLTVREPTTVGGRAGVQFSAVPVAGDRRHEGHEGYERVVAVVDATLGFLLCCEFQFGDRDAEVMNFVSLAVGAEADPSVFAAPPGSIFGDGAAPGRFADAVFGQPGLAAARAVAGLAAAGLGVALAHVPGRRVDPFERATTEAIDPDMGMPADEPLPGSAGDGAGPGGTVPGSGGTPVGDDLLHLLYRGGVGMAPFTATLHEWTDGSAMLAAVPPSARQAGFGGVGFLIDAVRKQPDLADSMTVHTVYEFRAGGRNAYRIDRVSPGSGTPTGHTGRTGLASWVTIAGDGSRRWQVYSDRVEVGAATSLPEPAAELVDGSWLLRCRLDGGEEVVADGRPGYRVIATARPGAAPSAALGWVSGARLPAVAVVDAATGRLLRLTRYLGGQPAERLEFRSVADGGPDDFGFTPPDGLRVADRSERRVGQARLSGARTGVGYSRCHGGLAVAFMRDAWLRCGSRSGTGVS